MSAMEAYKAVGYKGNARSHAWEIVANRGVREAIDEKLAQFTKSVADNIKQSTQEAFEKQLHLMRSAENEFVQLNASKEILDRGGLKTPDNIILGGQEDNPVSVVVISPAGQKTEIDDKPE